MLSRLRWRWSWVAAVTLVAIAGCQKEVPPTRFEATLVASADLNPTADGRAAPLLVRIYPLRAAGAFESADFFSVYERGDTLLAADTTAPAEELNMLPGQSKPVQRQLSDDTRFVAVLAAYRDVDNATWRAVVPIKANTTNTATIKLEKLAVKVEPGAQ